MQALGHATFGHSAEWYHEKLAQDIRDFAPAGGTIEEALYNALLDLRTAEEKLNELRSHDVH